MAANASVPPPAMWAQSNSCILFTYKVECKDPVIKLAEDSVSFKGTCLPENNVYEGVINLYAKIVPEKCTITNKGRYIFVELVKAVTNGPFWPRLTTENVKHHWLKVDFGKMQEENDSDEEMSNKNTIEDMMREMGGLDDMRDRPDFNDGDCDDDIDDIKDDDRDDNDSTLPDLIE